MGSGRSDAPRNPAAGAPPRGDRVQRPEELLVTRQHEIRVVLPASLLWWHIEGRRRKAVGCQEGAAQALEWADRHPEGPEGHSELEYCAGAISPRCPAFPGRPSPPLVPSAPHLSFLLPLPLSNEVFPGGIRPPAFYTAPFGVILSTNSLTPSCPHTQSPCPIYSASALPARLSLLAGFLAGLRSPFRVRRLQAPLPSAGAAALPPAGAQQAAAPQRGSGSPAFRAVIDRDSVCRCRPMMERGGSGGPAPLGAGMRRRRPLREPGSESRRSPHSNARVPAGRRFPGRAGQRHEGAS